MKILMITPYLPYPLFSGGQVRSYNLIKELSKSHEITLFSIIRDEKELEYLEKLTPYCTKIRTFHRGKAFTLRNILLSGFTFYPFLLVLYHLPVLKKAIEEEIQKTKYDVVHAETFYVMHNIPVGKVPVILFEQNIEYKVYRLIARYFQPFFLRPLLFFDSLKIEIWEKKFWQKAARVVFMSEEEKTAAGIAGDVSGNGVDTDYYRLITKKRDQRILFLGNFKWYQSVDAVRFILDHIWPKIKEKLPDAKLIIVGKYIPGKLKRKEEKNIVFSEHAPDDTRKIYEEADVLLAPIRTGGGSSFKVLEAMATGLPVVTTPLVQRVLVGRNGENMLVAEGDDGDGFAEKTVSLLQNDSMYNRIARNARKHIVENYDWRILARQIESTYKKALEKN